MKKEEDLEIAKKEKIREVEKTLMDEKQKEMKEMEDKLNKVS